MGNQEYVLKPIGKVMVGKDGYYIKIDIEFLPALQELEGFSHINVLWWFDKNDNAAGRSHLSCKTPYKNAPDKIGVFATRSPFRPNPIGLTAVQILGIDHEEGIIRIAYIDADDGTPVLDIKPYHPSCDRVRDFSVPQWCTLWPQWYEDSASFDWDSLFNF
jgi:tRNA (adenine37-N6)-methyltransferase